MNSLNEIIRIGKKLGKYRLIDGAGGNISIRDGDRITITKSGAVLDELDEKSLITIRIGERREGVSSDHLVHELIYKKTDFNAVIHCHGIYNVIISLTREKFIPVDFEGKLILKEVEIVDGEFGSSEYAEKIADLIKNKRVVLSRGHGIYSAGYNLKEAFNLASYVEHSCEIAYRLEMIR